MAIIYIWLMDKAMSSLVLTKLIFCFLIELSKTFFMYSMSIKNNLLFVQYLAQQGENILRCTTQDKKGLVILQSFFYPIF
jgi:hypothetical protein